MTQLYTLWPTFVHSLRPMWFLNVILLALLFRLCTAMLLCWQMVLVLFEQTETGGSAEVMKTVAAVYIALSANTCIVS